MCIFTIIAERDPHERARSGKNSTFSFDGMEFADGAAYLSNEESPGCTNRMWKKLILCSQVPSTAAADV